MIRAIGMVFAVDAIHDGTRALAVRKVSVTASAHAPRFRRRGCVRRVAYFLSWRNGGRGARHEQVMQLSFLGKVYDV